MAVCQRKIVKTSQSSQHSTLISNSFLADSVYRYYSVALLSPQSSIKAMLGGEKMIRPKMGPWQCHWLPSPYTLLLFHTIALSHFCKILKQCQKDDYTKSVALAVPLVAFALYSNCLQGHPINSELCQEAKKLQLPTDKNLGLYLGRTLQKCPHPIWTLGVLN